MGIFVYMIVVCVCHYTCIREIYVNRFTILAEASTFWSHTNEFVHFIFDNRQTENPHFGFVCFHCEHIYLVLYMYISFITLNIYLTSNPQYTYITHTLNTKSISTQHTYIYTNKCNTNMRTYPVPNHNHTIVPTLLYPMNGPFYIYLLLMSYYRSISLYMSTYTDNHPTFNTESILLFLFNSLELYRFSVQLLV